MIPVAEPSLGEEELRNLVEAIKSGWISSKGQFILDFEEKFARYCGAKYGVATSSGTTALHLALTALEIGHSDEVIVPTLSFIATANAVSYTGAKPVFADSHPDYWCIDPEKIETMITPKTKAIIPVHLYGHPCEMVPLLDIAERHHLYVIEDAAEAHGAEYKGKKVGSFGDISCFSFFGNKVITTGEGGMCLTNNDYLAERMRILRDHGMNPSKRYWYDILGFNYRMTNLQAAVGLAQLEKLDAFVERKREIAGWYQERLQDLVKDKLLELSLEQHWAKSVYWMYSILVREDFGMHSDELMRRLELNGIETRPIFYPIHTMPPHKSRKRMPVAEEVSRRGISLPSSVNLTAEQVAYISEIIIKQKP